MRPRALRWWRLGRVSVLNLLWGVAIAFLLVYAGLTVFHLSQGFDFGSALGGGIHDFRVVAVCFGEWGAVKEFIAREPFFGKDVGGLGWHWTCRAGSAGLSERLVWFRPITLFYVMF